MTINEKYEIEFTNECQREMRKIYNYISNNLYAENAAKKIMNKIEKLTNNLAYTPKLYAEIDKYKSTEMIYRKMPINNYLLLYTVDDENKKVYIVHMYYAGSDYINKIWFLSNFKS